MNASMGIDTTINNFVHFSSPTEEQTAVLRAMEDFVSSENQLHMNSDMFCIYRGTVLNDNNNNHTFNTFSFF